MGRVHIKYEGSLENISYARQQRKTPYVDNIALKTHYIRE